MARERPSAEIMHEKQINIGIDATTWSNDRGFGRFTRELLKALALRDSGFSYTLLFDEEPREPLPAGIKTLCVSTRHTLNQALVGDSSRSLSYIWKVGRAAREAEFDLFFFPAVYSYFPIFARVPCVVCYHDTTAERFPDLLFPSRRNRCLWWAKTFLARLQTTRAMTVSQSSADDLVNILHFKRERVDVVTEAADPVFRVLQDSVPDEEARVRYGIPEGAKVLVYVGGMNRHKNVAGLLEAFPRVIERHPDTHLVIVGSTAGDGFWDNVPELQALVACNSALAKRVHFTGRIDDDELVELLNTSVALVFPSLWEGFGLPAVEAMSCGIPVLASERGSLPEVVGSAGLFFDPESSSSISDCLIQFLGDAGLRVSLAAEALRRAETFTWERAAELAENCFRRCLEDTRGR